MYGREKLVAALDAAVQNKVYTADCIELILRQKSRPVENALGYLHVTRGADLVDVKVAESDLDAYKKYGGQQGNIFRCHFSENLAPRCPGAFRSPSRPRFSV